MPRFIYNIGDYVIHDNYGKGIVVGLQTKNGMPIHHIRFFTKSHTFKYVRDEDINHLHRLQEATPDHVKTAQNLMLDLFNESRFRDNRRWVGESLPGDIIQHPVFGKCLVIGADERGFHGNKRRHVYSYDHDLFYYVDMQNFPILQMRTSDSLKQVHKLWLEHVLPQPYAADGKELTENEPI